eukprot:gene45410-60668_t
MSENYNPLVVHYGGAPDMWSTKPPLTNWAQVFFIKTLGLNVLSVRLPSALAGLFTSILLWLFCVRHLKNYWMGFVSVLVLVTSRGFINNHVTRTADYDAMLLTGDKPYFGYYLHLMKTEHFLHWFWISAAGIILALGFLAVVSSANTQMLWYNAPVYPFAALLAAIAIYWLVE